MKELGLTPASRARMNKSKVKDNGEFYTEEDREMEQLFND